MFAKLQSTHSRFFSNYSTPENGHGRMLKGVALASALSISEERQKSAFRPTWLRQTLDVFMYFELVQGTTSTSEIVNFCMMANRR